MMDNKINFYGFETGVLLEKLDLYSDLFSDFLFLFLLLYSKIPIKDTRTPSPATINSIENKELYKNLSHKK